MGKLKKKLTKPLPIGHTIKKEGGRKIQVPILSGAVGPKNLYLDLTYGPMNQPMDVELIQYYFSDLADVGYLPGGIQAGAKTCLMRSSAAVGAWETDLFAAIRAFQSAAGIADADEVTYGIIRPGGPTLIQLVDLSEAAAALQQLAERATDPRDYIHRGGFDMDRFIREYKADFGKDARYHASKEPNLRRFLGYMQRDPMMIDIRWMAYILATVYWEDARLETVEQEGNTGAKKVRVWRVDWTPIEEVGKGKGRAYFRPVKVKQLDDGSAIVTEQDGDQWSVNTMGKWKAHGSKNTKRLPAQAPAKLANISPTYTKDDGTPNAYYGRGYQQLTWWFNYATAGVAINRGLDLLFDPALALDPQVSYNVFSHCVRTGASFANNHKISDFIYGDKTDYDGARAMINPDDKVKQIPEYAKKFEAILKKAKL